MDNRIITEEEKQKFHDLQESAHTKMLDAGIRKGIGAYISIRERVKAIQDENIYSNEIRGTNRTTNAKTIERKIIAKMCKGGSKNKQNKRRKLVRQNPSLYRSKKHK